MDFRRPCSNLINNQIPADFSRMILRCLEKDKAKRYQSAEELASVLNKIEKGVPTTDRLYPKRRTEKIRQIGEIVLVEAPEVVLVRPPVHVRNTYHQKSIRCFG